MGSFLELSNSGNGKIVSKVGNLEIIRNTFCLVDSHK